MTSLSAARVHEIMRDCLFHDDEPKTPRIEVQAVTTSFGFHPERLAKHKPEILQMLHDLPEPFQETSSSGGGSFLQACEDREGNQWAEHATMELLFAMGLAIGRVMSLFPRPMWQVLPGGVPVYVVRAEEKFDPMVKHVPSGYDAAQTPGDPNHVTKGLVEEAGGGDPGLGVGEDLALRKSDDPRRDPDFGIGDYTELERERNTNEGS